MRFLSCILSFMMIFLVSLTCDAEIVDIEMLKNGGFEEDDISMWKSSNGGVFEKIEDSKTGKFACKITRTGDGAEYGAIKQDITEKINEYGAGRYIISMWAKLPSDSTITNDRLTCYIRGFCADKEETYPVVGDINSTSYTKISFYADIPTVLTNAYFSFQTTQATPILIVDDLSITKKGDVPTPPTEDVFDIIPKNAVGVWNFQDKTEDISGFGTAIELKDGATYSENGIVGKGLDLSTEGAYAQIPNYSQLTSQTNLTIMTSVYLNSLPKKDCYFVPIAKEENGYSYKITIDYSGAVRFFVQTENNPWYTDGTAVVSVTKLATGSWYHISAVYDGKNLYIYINGIADCMSNSPISGNISASDGSIKLGYNSGGIDFDGLIDEIAIINVSFDKTQIFNQYLLYSSISQGLVSSYSFDGNLNDLGSNKATGVLNGSAKYVDGVLGQCVNTDGDNNGVSADLWNWDNTNKGIAISVWINFPEFTGGGYASIITISGLDFMIKKENSILQTQVRIGGHWYDADNPTGVLGVTPLKPNSWNHIVLTYDGSYVYLYLNGILNNKTNIKVDGNVTLRGPLTMGQTSVAGRTSYIGLMDELKIYKRGLNHSEVKTLYDSCNNMEEDHDIKKTDGLIGIVKNISVSLPECIYIPDENSKNDSWIYNIDVKDSDGNNITADKCIITPNRKVSSDILDYGVLKIDKGVAEGTVDLNIATKSDLSVNTTKTIKLIPFVNPKIDNMKISGSIEEYGDLNVTFDFSDISNNLPKTKIVYEWKRNNIVLSNITGDKYTLKPDDDNTKISVSVTAYNALLEQMEKNQLDFPKNTKTISADITYPRSSSGGSFSSTSGGSFKPTEPVAPIAPVIPVEIFSDLNGHWAKKDIEIMAEKGFVKGNSDKKFNPNMSITRAEFVCIVVRAFNLESEEILSFKDVNVKDWFATELSSAGANGIISKSDYFRPNDFITREEMAKIIAETYLKFKVGEIEEVKQQKINDLEEISDWAVKYVMYTYELGLIKGDDKNNFSPKKNAMRAEATVVVKRLLDTLKN